MQNNFFELISNPSHNTLKGFTNEEGNVDLKLKRCKSKRN